MRPTLGRFAQLVIIVLLALRGSASVASGQEFYLGPNEHVLFYGDSKPGERLYESFIETFVITRFPQRSVRFTRSRWYEGPELAALTSQPTVIVVAPEAGNLVQAIAAALPGVRITALRSTPPPPEAARSGHTVQIDLIAPLAAVVEKAKARDPALAATILPNGLPGGEASQLLMAQALLQAWHAPALVSAVEIDALRGSVRRAENTTVRELESGRVIAWSQDDLALPMPVDFMNPTVSLATSCSDFMMVLDQQTLRIRGLAAEWYRLTIDGEPLGFFHAGKLDEGINLAGLPTPMWKQSMEVHVLTRKHDELQAARSRLFQAPEEERKSTGWEKALDALNAAESDLIDEQRAKARPRTHDYELQPVEN
jgi:hypothetical protein